MGIGIVQSGGLGWMPIKVGATTFRLLSSLHGFVYGPSAFARALPDDACITHFMGGGVGFDEFLQVTSIRDPARGHIQGDTITIQAVMRVNTGHHHSLQM